MSEYMEKPKGVWGIDAYVGAGLITTDKDYAYMSKDTMERLPEYSMTRPTGIYIGKVFISQYGIFMSDLKPEDRYWQLHWYGPVHGHPDKAQFHTRKIILTDMMKLLDPSQKVV